MKRELSNVEAVGEAVVGFRPEMIRVAFGLIGNWTDAEDLVHASCLRAIERSHRLRTRDNLRGWLQRIVHNVVIDHCRRRKKLVPLDNVPEPVSPERVPPDPWENLSESDVRAALGKCGTRCREAYELHVLSGLSYLEISRRLGVPIGTVGVRLFRARAQLRRILSETCAAS